jgi:hypothetical protein
LVEAILEARPKAQRGLVKGGTGDVPAPGQLPESVVRQGNDIIRGVKKAKEAGCVPKDGKKLYARDVRRTNALGFSMRAAQVRNDVIVRNAQTVRHPGLSEMQRRSCGRHYPLLF